MDTNTATALAEAELAALTRALAGQLADSDPYHVVLSHDTDGDETSGRLVVSQATGRRYVSIDAEHAITLRDASDPLLGYSPSEVVVGPAGQMLEDAAAIERAAEHISTTEVAPGIWAHHHDDATDRWHMVTGAALAELCDYLDDEDPAMRGDAYSHWCAYSMATEMPAGWMPGDTYPPAKVVTCQCGSWSGCACEWSGSDIVIVEYMPPAHRASHTAAANRGVLPHNGARRVRVSRECAALMLATDGEWCSLVGGAS